MRWLFLLCLLGMAHGAQAQSSSLNAPASASRTSVAASDLSVAGQHTLLGFTVAAPAAGFVMVFDAVSAPANGTVSPAACYPIPTPGAGQWSSLSMANTPIAVGVTTGITIVYSTTGCYTLTKSATAFISVIWQ